LEGKYPVSFGHLYMMYGFLVFLSHSKGLLAGAVKSVSHASRIEKCHK